MLKMPNGGDCYECAKDQLLWAMIRNRLPAAKNDHRWKQSLMEERAQCAVKERSEMARRDATSRVSNVLARNASTCARWTLRLFDYTYAELRLRPGTLMRANQRATEFTDNGCKNHPIITRHRCLMAGSAKSPPARRPIPRITSTEHPDAGRYMHGAIRQLRAM